MPKQKELPTKKPIVFPLEEILPEKRIYKENFETVQKIAGKIGCHLISFDPVWRLYYQPSTYSQQRTIDLPYEVMKELALLLGYEWIEKE